MTAAELRRAAGLGQAFEQIARSASMMDDARAYLKVSEVPRELYDRAERAAEMVLDLCIDMQDYLDVQYGEVAE